MAAPNKIVVELSPEFKSILKSIDNSLKQIAKNNQPLAFVVTAPQPASDPSVQEEGV